MDDKKLSYKLLSIDLDGTLLSPILRRAKVGDCRVLQKYMSLGGIPLINTGRAPWGIEKAVKQINKYGDHKIKLVSCLNGAYIKDYNDGTEIQTTIEHQYVRQIYDIVQNYKNSALFWAYMPKSLGKKYVFSNHSLWAIRWGFTLSKIRKLKDLSDLTSFKLDIITFSKKVCAKIYQELIKQDIHHFCTISHSSPRLIEVTPLNINKGATIDYFAKKYNIPLDKIASVGDSFNDLSAFKHSALAIGIRPRNPKLLEHCNAVIDHKSIGVGHAINKFLIQRELQKTKYKLIISDLDGTLIDDKTKQFSNPNKVVLQQCAHRLIPIAFATGRGFYNTLNMANSLRLDPANNIYIIADNGATIFNVNAKRYISQTPIAETDAIKLFEYLKKIVNKHKAKSGISIHQHAEEVMFYNQMFWKADNFKVTGYEDKYDFWIDAKPIYIDQYPTGIITYKVVIKFADAKLVDKYHQKIKKAFPNLEVCASSGRNVEINAKGINKGNAAKLLAKTLNIPIKNFLALADGENDLQLLDACPNSFAPCYSLPSVKKHAKHVVEDVDYSNFAYKVIKHNILKKKKTGK